MKKILDNYCSIDRCGYDLVAKRCTDWADAHITNPAEIFTEIVEAGGQIVNGPTVGMCLFGNMYNPELGLSGEIWVTSAVTSVDEDDNGHLWAETATGSRYLLLDAYTERSFESVFNQIIAVAPEPLQEYLWSHAPFWAPEILWHNLSVAVNRYVAPDSSDDASVKIYAILCNCTEDDMIRRFKADGF